MQPQGTPNIFWYWGVGNSAIPPSRLRGEHCLEAPSVLTRPECQSVRLRADSDLILTGVADTNALRGSPLGEFKCPTMTGSDQTCLLGPSRLSTPGSEKGDQKQCGLHPGFLAPGRKVDPWRYQTVDWGGVRRPDQF